jgi:molecular chaperone DnaJ
MSTRTVQARIPAGVKNGSRIRLKGKGSPGERGGPNGDLFVDVTVSTHVMFDRKGDNVTISIPVTFVEAALGSEIGVPTPRGGSVTLKIPAATSNGSTFRVRGKGFRKADGTNGDLLVTVEVSVPEVLSDEARTALQQFAEHTSDHDPRKALLEWAESAK